MDTCFWTLGLKKSCIVVGLADFLSGKVTFNNSSPALRARVQASHLNLETRSSRLKAWTIRVSRCKDRVWKMRGTILKFQWSRIEKQGFSVKLFLSSERTMLHSADQCCRAVFCNCLNCQLQQAFNKCKSIFSVSKIYPLCTVYVAVACHVPRFSNVNHQLRQASNGL